MEDSINNLVWEQQTVKDYVKQVPYISLRREVPLLERLRHENVLHFSRTGMRSRITPISKRISRRAHSGGAQAEAQKAAAQAAAAAEHLEGELSKADESASAWKAAAEGVAADKAALEQAAADAAAAHAALQQALQVLGVSLFRMESSRSALP